MKPVVPTSATIANAKPAAAQAASQQRVSGSDVLSRFIGGAAEFQALIQALQLQLEKEREELQQERDKLEHDRTAFLAESQRVHSVLSDSEQVVLNVGGTKFATTLYTLRNAPESLFTAMFSGRHALKTDEEGCFFIDRDGRHFHDILNYLRDRHLNYPPDGTDFKYLSELRAEAEFYGLVGLTSEIDKYPWGLTRVQRAVSLNTEDLWLYEDGQDEVVFTVDRACQLLGVGLCGTEGAITVELAVLEVEKDDFSKEVTQLQDAAQSFTKADGQLVRLMLNAPVALQPDRAYMVSAMIKGNVSYCSEECMSAVIAGNVRVCFQSWESPNGTNETRGQFPELFIRVI